MSDWDRTDGMDAGETAAPAPDADALIDAVAARHGVERDAVAAALAALIRGGGQMAQFAHPAFGGMAQWQAGGLSMAGAPFDDELKARLDAVCTDLSQALADGRVAPDNEDDLETLEAKLESELEPEPASAPASWWPAELGQPSASGTQGETRYAVFPATRRLALWREGALETYDTGETMISGVGQAEGGLRFSGASGDLDLAALRRLPSGSDAGIAPAPLAASSVAARVEPGESRPAEPNSPQDIADRIEQIGRLRLKGLLTEAEFSAKKAELLARL